MKVKNTCEATRAECLFLISTLFVQIAGFINAIQPFCGDIENLRAFRFYALNPIVDPWVFIICRKSVFRHLSSVLSCRFSKGAVKTTAQNCALSLPLDSHAERNPSDVAVQQTNTYSSLALWPTGNPPSCRVGGASFAHQVKAGRCGKEFPSWLWKEWLHLFLNVRRLMETVPRLCHRDKQLRSTSNQMAPKNTLQNHCIHTPVQLFMHECYLVFFSQSFFYKTLPDNSCLYSVSMTWSAAHIQDEEIVVSGVFVLIPGMWNLCCPLQAVTVITQIQKYTFSQQLRVPHSVVWM